MDPAALNELYLAALCIWREMRGRGDPERLGCYWVIRNRAADPMRRWPKSLAGVVTQRFQFSSFNPTSAEAIKWPIADGSPDWRAWCDIVASLIAWGAELPPDPTGGANSYEACTEAQPRPRWADPAKLTKEIGETRFYKL